MCNEKKLFILAVWPKVQFNEVQDDRHVVINLDHPHAYHVTGVRSRVTGWRYLAAGASQIFFSASTAVFRKRRPLWINNRICIVSTIIVDLRCCVVLSVAESVLEAYSSFTRETVASVQDHWISTIRIWSNHDNSLFWVKRFIQDRCYSFDQTGHQSRDSSTRIDQLVKCHRNVARRGLPMWFEREQLMDHCLRVKRPRYDHVTSLSRTRQNLCQTNRSKRRVVITLSIWHTASTIRLINLSPHNKLFSCEPFWIVVLTHFVITTTTRINITTNSPHVQRVMRRAVGRSKTVMLHASDSQAYTSFRSSIDPSNLRSTVILQRRRAREGLICRRYHRRCTISCSRQPRCNFFNAKERRWWRNTRHCRDADQTTKRVLVILGHVHTRMNHRCWTSFTFSKLFFIKSVFRSFSTFEVSVDKLKGFHVFVYSFV